MTEDDIQLALYWRHRSNCQIILANYWPQGWQECDIFVITKSGYTIDYEIKLTFADFRADFKKGKHYRMAQSSRTFWTPTRFFFAVPEGLIEPKDVPSYAGLMTFGAREFRLGLPEEIVRENIVRDAPRLNTDKASDRLIANMRTTAYYHFWNERIRFNRYRQAMPRVRRPGRA